MLTTFSLPPTPQPCTPVSQGCHNYFHTIHSLARNRVSTEMTHGIKPKLERANSVKAKEEALTLSYRQTLDPGKIGFKISLRIDSMVSQVLSSNAKTVVLRDAAAAKSLQSCLTLRPHRRQPTRLPRPWDSPGKNTGVGCHFLLQCMKVKSESEVTQSCLTLRNPMDCSLPGSSIHGISQARVLELGAIAFKRWEASKS